MQLTNPAVDFNQARDSLMSTGYAVIPDFLAADTAALLADTLSATDAWEFWSRGEDGTVVHAPERWRALSAEAQSAQIPPHEPVGDGFHFAYERVTPDPTSPDPTLRTLGGFVAALNSPGYIDLMRQVVRHPEVNHIDGAFSRYRRGHFLSPHTDANRDQIRLVAQVLALTPNWAPDWGGDLVLCDANGAPERVLAPTFNTLVLFTVPRLHYVTPVKADGARYSFFSWLVARNLKPHSTDITRRVA